MIKEQKKLLTLNTNSLEKNFLESNKYEYNFEVYNLKKRNCYDNLDWFRRWDKLFKGDTDIIPYRYEYKKSYTGNYKTNISNKINALGQLIYKCSRYLGERWINEITNKELSSWWIKKGTVIKFKGTLYYVIDEDDKNIKEINWKRKYKRKSLF